MINEIILGIVQGITEWLPISSSGMLILVESNFLGGITTLSESLQFALFLHLGTFFAALLYFRKEVFSILNTALNYKESGQTDRNILLFLIIATFISGILGYTLLTFIEIGEDKLDTTSKSINFFIGIMLLITAFAQLNPNKKNKIGDRKEKDLNAKDGMVLGLLQGVAPIPGLSRSGLTIAGLLLRKFSEETALKLSFLMSLPIVAGGNIALVLFETKTITYSSGNVMSLLFSFIFGLLTIHLLLKLAKKIQFGYFALFFGILLIAAFLLPIPSP